jgi:hypothetical protein
MRAHIAKYEKPKPSKSDGLLYLFCEGQNTEPSYFNYFKRKYSKLNIYIVPFPPNGNNTPSGILENCLQTIQNPQNDYAPESDSIWLCMDIDDRAQEVLALKTAISATKYKISLALSNRSFEVWLYFHFFTEIGQDSIINWKSFLNSKIPGGFDVRKHPSLALHAIANAASSYQEDANGLPAMHATNVFELVKTILALST